MKTRNVAMHSESKPKITLRSEIVGKEGSNSAPTPAEIRQRAFEIHIERGAIHGGDLDDWLQAERELQEKFKDKERQERRTNE